MTVFRARFLLSVLAPQLSATEDKPIMGFFKEELVPAVDCRARAGVPNLFAKLRGKEVRPSPSHSPGSIAPASRPYGADALVVDGAKP
jgi:hypothetical protein